MNSNVKIAIVHDFLTKIGGSEKLLSVVHELYPQAPIYTLLYSKKGTNNYFENKDYKIIPSYLNKYPDFLIRKPRLFLSKLPFAIESFNFSNYDLVISISNSFAHGVITSPATFHATYCNSPMRYSWDWYHQYLTENNIKFNLFGLIVRKILHQVRIWDKIASTRTDFWMANSNNVAKRISKYYRKDSITVYPPVDEPRSEKYNSSAQNYYLIISRLEPYKKTDIAVEAFNKNGRNLIIIGTGSELNKLKNIAKSNIKFLGWQNQNVVNEHLLNCRALIFPGEEDFGITPVEAMFRGKFVIALNAGGVKETVINNKTGVLFDGINPESLNKAVEKFEINYDKFDPRDSKIQAKKFSKSKFLNDFKKIIESEFNLYQKQYHEK